MSERVRLPIAVLFLVMLLTVGIVSTSPSVAAGSSVNQSDDGFGPTTPTWVTFQQLRESITTAYGIPPPQIIAIKGEVSDSAGSHSSYSEFVLGDDFAMYQSAGEVHRAFGDYGGQHWRQNENGQTVSLTLPPDVSVLDPRQLWKLILGPDAAVRVEGEIQTPFHAYVLALQSPAGHARFYIDVGTSLLDAAEMQFPNQQLQYTFKNYQLENGFAVPWVVEQSVNRGRYTATDLLTHYGFADAQGAAKLKIPSSKQLITFPRGSDRLRIASRFNGHDIIVRVNIQGRGLDFLLDSGTSGIVIDRDVAQQLGLSLSGSINFERSEGSALTYVKVPTLSIGSLQLHDLYVFAMPFAVNGDATTKYVGLLGYDFINQLVLRIDYEHQTVDAMPPERFVPPGSATMVALALDEGVPMTRAQSGNDWARVMVDTGSAETLFFSKYLAARGVKEPDFKHVAGKLMYYPLASGTLYGLVPTVPYTFAFLRFNEFYFNNALVYVTYKVPKFEDPDCDGMIGASLLSYFNVYLDYPDAKMYLEPNDSFKRVEGH